MENANSHSQREKNSTEEESLMAIDTIIIGTLVSAMQWGGSFDTRPPPPLCSCSISIDLGRFPTNKQTPRTLEK